ncbi:MAG: gamma-glutamyltransferase, partial [Reyranella sp.]|nr:gamma-glutamyltransferase [Reyranella sp.]
MSKSNWRDRAGTKFTCEKQPARGKSGMAVSNHPLASAAGAEMLAAGGNAIDAAVAMQFALTVVEPMMVGLIGGTTCHIRLADGSHRILDGMSAVPKSGHPDMYKPIPGAAPEVYDVEGAENLVGPKSVAAPGSLRAWCLALERYGTMPLGDVMQPAIRHAARGFAVTPYLADCIKDAAPDLSKDRLAAARLLPDGIPLKPGARLIQGDYAEALTLVSQQGEKALHGGPLGDLLVECMEKAGGFVSRADLTGYKVAERAPIRGRYRGWEILGPPPPAASGVHITQMLNILEGYDIAELGFGTVDTLHLLAEVLKIAFADRAEASGDPDFVKVPVERIVAKNYADARRSGLDLARAIRWTGGLQAAEGADTTHLTVADGKGN